MKAARASSIGLQFGISILLGALAGGWLDKRFGSDPWCLMAGVFFGAAAGFRDLWLLGKAEAEDD